MMSFFYEFNAVDNLLTGTIPSQFQKLKKLQMLNLGKLYVSLIFDISILASIHIILWMDLICMCLYIVICKTGSNQLRGTIPDFIKAKTDAPDISSNSNCNFKNVTNKLKINWFNEIADEDERPLIHLKTLSLCKYM